MPQAVLEAALKPSAAQSYPYLPVRMWTTARRLAELVARYRGIPVEAVDRIDRVLSDRDFMFRSGCHVSEERRAEIH
jgi:hypothetical protein